MYVCSNCKTEFSKWLGKCKNCGEWGTVQEINLNASPFLSLANRTKKNINNQFKKNVSAIKIKDLKNDFSSDIKSNIYEFDNTLGGRMLAGQTILLSGAPGIGKSTLLLQLIDQFSNQGKNVLYICGEESPVQIKHRVDRLKLKMLNVDFLSERNIDTISFFVQSYRTDGRNFDVLVVDSIQTVYSESLSSVNGSVSQVAHCTNNIVELAKSLNILTFIVGHITKSGLVAGPMILGHMVDTVLLFEGSKYNDLRFLRVLKNRFGPTDSVGIFRMENEGLKEVLDFESLIKHKKIEDSGLVFSMVNDGNRQMIVETEALVSKSYYSNPRRTVSGFDLNRLFLLLAVLEKQCGLKMYEYDIFINIVGDVKVSDFSLDLPVCLAIISSLYSLSLPTDSIAFGEVSLTGRIKKTYMHEKKVQEAIRMGFRSIYSYENLKHVKNFLTELKI